MATKQLLAPIPNVVLGPGMVIRLEALDASTGAAVAGVKASSITIAATDKSDTTIRLDAGPIMFVPGPNEAS